MNQGNQLLLLFPKKESGRTDLQKILNGYEFGTNKNAFAFAILRVKGAKNRLILLEPNHTNILLLQTQRLSCVGWVHHRQPQMDRKLQLLSAHFWILDQNQSSEGQHPEKEQRNDLTWKSLPQSFLLEKRQQIGFIRLCSSLQLRKHS